MSRKLCECKQELPTQIMTSDKLSIKNLLFSKALPNYIPDAAVGIKTYLCTDCGDKYIFESSLNMHINRKSVKITYMCRHCGQIKIFLNRCKLLSHIRSHSFKTATINVSDLNIEPLPLEYFNLQPSFPATNDIGSLHVSNKPSPKSKDCCFECKKDIGLTGVLYKDRAEHYMQVSGNIACYSCPICRFTLPTSCGLKAHLRIHLKIPPYFCPECGVHIPNKCVNYPFNHDCEGFKTMRATTRLKCKNKNCTEFHPNEYREHMKSHIIKVFKCLQCSSTWLNEPPKENHLQCLNLDPIILKYFKCPICPDKLLSSARLERHLSGHFNSNINIMDLQVFPCRQCKEVFNKVYSLLNHQIKKHGASKIIIESLVDPNSKNQEVFVVVKRCEKCLRNFKYKCPYDKIKSLPNECPYKCVSSKVKCFVCKIPINAHWNNIKRHFSALHKEHKCVDVKVNLIKLNSSTIIAKTKKNQKLKIKKIQSVVKCDTLKKDNGTTHNNSLDIFKCSKCDDVFKSKIDLETHITSHRDLGMAYQCLECGQCFAVKPSFSTHLLLEHEISDADNYIADKHCFNELAFVKKQNDFEKIEEGPLLENQCKICREQFDDNNSLEKHFRVHGMAFLKENTIKSPV